MTNDEAFVEDDEFAAVRRKLWPTPGVGGGTSFFSDTGHEVTTTVCRGSWPRHLVPLPGHSA